MSAESPAQPKPAEEEAASLSSDIEHCKGVEGVKA